MTGQLAFQSKWSKRKPRQKLHVTMPFITYFGSLCTSFLPYSSPLEGITSTAHTQGQRKLKFPHKIRSIKELENILRKLY